MSAQRKRPDIWQRARKAGWIYYGDINIEHGGLFWKDVQATDYVECVEVTPCSDASGPDNVFEIVKGSIYFADDTERRNNALSCIGWYDHASIGPYPLAAIVEAARAYWGVEGDVYGRTVVRIGALDQFWQDNRGGWNPKPDKILPGNARLDNYVFAEHLD